MIMEKNNKIVEIINKINNSLYNFSLAFLFDGFGVSIKSIFYDSQILIIPKMNAILIKFIK